MATPTISQTSAPPPAGPLTAAGTDGADGTRSEASDSSASPAPAVAPASRPITGRPPPRKRKRTLGERVEAFISKLSTRNNFWHRVCSLIWLPFAFRSGIKMKRLGPKTFTAVLPFRRFNRNWYNAMAGAALLGNSEIAGGMYVFGVCGGDYTVVCKKMNYYEFLRPCYGPAVYTIAPRENIEELLAHGGEFNITVDLDIAQAITKPGEREKRVGRCSLTFHVTPKLHQKSKRERKTNSRKGAAPVPTALPASTDPGQPPPT